MLRAMTDPDHGRPVWYELLTTDPQAAIAFYTDVIGWKTQAWGDEGYRMWVAGQGPLGGVSLLPEAVRQMGAPPFWQGSFQVTNVDDAIAHAQRLGGKVHHVETVPTVGRLAVIADPQGAAISLFTPERAMPPHDIGKPGEVAWHELYTSDYRAGFEFYHQLLGWERLAEMDMGALGKYLLWGRGGKQLGGMMTLPDHPPSWLYYVTTDDLDAALARAQARGARVLNGPMPVPTGQHIVQLVDPQGAAFALVTPPA